MTGSGEQQGTCVVYTKRVSQELDRGEKQILSKGSLDTPIEGAIETQKRILFSNSRRVTPNETGRLVSGKHRYT